MCDLMSGFNHININVLLMAGFNFINMGLFFCGLDSSSDSATTDEVQTTPLIPRRPPPTYLTFKSGF